MMVVLGIARDLLVSMRQERAASRGEPPLIGALQDASVEDILKVRASGKSLFRRAIEDGWLNEALDVLAARGGKMDMGPMLRLETGAHNTNVEEVAQQIQLDRVFRPELWVGNVRRMKGLWVCLSADEQTQLDGRCGRPDFKELLQRANMLTTRSQRHGRQL